jgi:hypothetical protein
MPGGAWRFQSLRELDPKAKGIAMAAQYRTLDCRLLGNFRGAAERLLLAAQRPSDNNNPPAEPEVFRLRPPQRGLIAIDERQTHGACKLIT